MFSAGSNSAFWLIDAKDGSSRVAWQPESAGTQKRTGGPSGPPARTFGEIMIRGSLAGAPRVRAGAGSPRRSGIALRGRAAMPTQRELLLVLHNLAVELVDERVDRSVHVELHRLDVDVLASRMQIASTLCRSFATDITTWTSIT
jgi:hypothetical protein